MNKYIATIRFEGGEEVVTLQAETMQNAISEAFLLSRDKPGFTGFSIARFEEVVES